MLQVPLVLPVGPVQTRSRSLHPPLGPFRWPEGTRWVPVLLPVPSRPWADVHDGWSWWVAPWCGWPGAAPMQQVAVQVQAVEQVQLVAVLVQAVQHVA